MQFIRSVRMVALCGLMLAGSAGAQSVWDGGGTDNNWDNATNWVGNVALANPSTNFVYLAGTTRVTPSVNVPWTIQGLVVSNAGAFVLGGTTLTLTANSSAAGAINSFDHRGTNAFVANNPIVLLSTIVTNARRTFLISGAGNATFNGLVTNSAGGMSELWVRGAGAGQGRFNGRITIGANKIFRTDTATWVIASTNNQWGVTELDQSGTLRIAISDALPTNTIVQFDSNLPRLDLSNFNQTVRGFQGNGGFIRTGTGTGGRLTVSDIGNSYSFGGGVTENGSVLKRGAGVLTFTNNTSSFTNTLIVAEGTFVAALGNNAAAPASTAIGVATTVVRQLIVSNGATLRFAANDIMGNATANPSPVIVLNGGLLLLSTNTFNSLGAVVLNGGSISNLGGASATYEAARLIGPIVATGSVPSFIGTLGGANNRYHLMANTVFDVADVTASPAADLTVGPALINQTPGQASAAGGMTKQGAGTLRLDGANVFSGQLAIAAGTVSLGASASLLSTSVQVGAGTVLDLSEVASYVLPAAQTLQGAGTIAGALSLGTGTRLTPGGLGTPGTLTVTGDVVVTAAAYTNLFDLTNSLTAGGGVNDLLQIGGVFEPGGSVVHINPIAPLVSGSYRLINYSGTKTSTFDPVVQGNTYRGQSWSLDDTVPGQVDLIVTSGTPAFLRWTADTSADWDLGTTNWTDTGSSLADRYFDFDTVLFDDAGGDSNIVNITAVVRPAALTVDSASNYVFAGSGRIADGFTPLALVKSGPGSLTLALTNTFSGGLILSNGTVVVATNDVAGYGTIVFAGGGLAGDGGAWTLANNLRLDQAGSVDPAGGTLTLTGYLTGSGDFRKTGSGTVTLPANPPGDLWTGSVTVAAGTLAITSGGNAYPFGGSSASSRTVTVDAGATLAGANGADNLLGENALGIMRLVVSNGTVLAPRYLHARAIETWGGAILASGAPVDGLDLRTGAYLRVWSDANTATIDTKVTLRGDTPVDVDDGANPVDLAFTTNFAGNSFFLVKTNAGTMVLSGNIDNNSLKLRNEQGTTVLAKASSATVHALGLNGLGLVINGGTVQFAGSGDDQLEFRVDTLLAGGATLDFNGRSEGFDELSGTGTVLNSAASTVGTMSLGGNNAANFIFAGSILDGAGQMALTKQGTGTFTLSGNSAYTGQTTIQTGTLVIAGTVTGSVAVIASNATLAGTGAFNGTVIGSGGSRVIPGSANSISTLTLSSLTLQANDILPFELTNTTTVGGGVNDLIAVGGGLEPNGATIQILPRAPLASGTYTLLTYGGAKVSTFSAAVSNTTRKTLAIDETTANQINLVVSGSYLDLKWNPQVSTNWDMVGADWLDTVGLTNTTFLDGDNVTFNESGAVTNDVNLAGLVQPGTMTVEGASNYVIRGAGRLGGTMNLNKSGTGELLLGGTNTFVGPVIVSNGVLRIGSMGALGQSTSVTIAAGAQLNLNGYGQTNYFYNLTVAGAGPDGRGAIVNTNANIGANSSIRWVTLTGDTTIGALGSTIANEGVRFDIANAGWIQGNGYTLTKVGVSPLPLRGGATNLQVVVAEGLVYAETVTNSLGSNVVVQAGAILGGYGNIPGGVVYTPVTLNGGTLSSRSGAGAITWAGPVTLASNSFVSTCPGYGYGEENITISGEISGPGSLTKISNNTLTVTATNSYLGGTFIAKGTLAIGNGALSGSILGGITNNGVVRYSRSDSFTLANTITGNGSLYVNVASGLVVDATASISLGTSIEVPKSGVGSLIVMPGASITASNLFLGNDSGFRGEVRQHGGSVTVNAGSLRVGHWSNETSLYLMAGGSLVVTNETATNPQTATGTEPGGALYVGTDGTGIMIMTGGTVRAGGIVMDNRGDTTAGTDILAFEGGTITLGRWGIQGVNNSCVMLLGGGTFSADTNWVGRRPMTLTGTNGPTVFDPAGWTVTVTGHLSGVGGLVKNGNGTLVLQPSMPDSYTGGTVVNGGVLQLSYANGVGNLGTIRGALTVNSGAVARATLEKAIGFATAASGNVTVVTINEGLLDFTGLNGLGGGQTYLLNGGEIRSNLGVPTSTGGALRINATGTNWTIHTTASNAIPLISGRIALDTTNARFDVADSTNASDLAITATITDGIFGNAVNSLVKTNTGTMALHGVALYSGPTLVDGGRLLVQTTGAPGTGTNTLTVGAGGTLGGTGLVGGTVVSDGLVAPGASAGVLTVGRDYTQNAGGTLAIELGGNVVGVTHDLLAVSNAASLAGALNVTLVDGFVPATNDVFLILDAASVSGTFSSTVLPVLGAGQGWAVQYLPGEVMLSITSAPTASGYDLAAGVITNGLSGYNDDADGDGYANLLEYVTGGSLTNPGTQARMNGGRTNGVLALKFTRDGTATDATIYVEGSYTATNGADWVGIATNLAGSWGGSTNVTEDVSSPINVTVQDSVSVATNRFLRLRVTRP